MQMYDADISVAEGLSQYLKKYNLGDGGYNDKWFKINFFWKATLVLPNISNRVQAVKFHDLHHVLAEYETGLKGEAEIGAWEVASGCGKYYAAWLLNIGSLLYGFILFPSAVYKAFIRGRQNKNLYHNIEYGNPLLNSSVGEMRMKLGIGESHTHARASDVAAFCLWSLIVLSVYLLGLFILYRIVTLFL
jgi:hypothetical protein